MARIPSRYAKKEDPLLSFEEKAAKDAGFSSVLQQQVNRTLRNQLEQTALGKGYTDLNAIYSEAQRAAGGGDLTSNATLQKMYEYVAGKEAFKKEEVVETPPPQVLPPEPPKPEEPKGPSMADIAAQFSTQIQEMQKGFMESMQAQSAQFQQMQTAQQERMAEMQQQMLQSQMQQQQRPEVAGVKMATGAGGTPMQIARRGVTGAFGRRGMRISSLNV